MPRAKDVIDTVGMATRVVEATVPGAAAFAPAIEFVMTAIRAHFAATGTLPDEATVMASVPARIRDIQGMWAAYVPSGDGTLPGAGAQSAASATSTSAPTDSAVPPANVPQGPA